jgi:methyl-accepting chemotaxis protein
MAAGDLAVVVPVRGTDEMADLSAHFNTLAQGLRRMIADLRAAAEQVGAATRAIGDTSRAQVQAVHGDSAALEETASTVAEMAVASRLATESAQLVIEVAERSETLWRQGALAVRDGMVGLTSLEGRVGAIAGAVTELSERTVQIAGIIATVKDLAEQSNVLALNAAIEAAKVGAAGKGFAVVAEEMRRLAEQSRRATDDVRANLVELQRATRKVVVATGEGSEQARAAALGAEQASTTISGLATAIEESSQAARGIADTTRRQTEEMEGIASAVEDLHRNMGTTLQGAQRIEEVAQELARVSERLAQAVSTYRI